MIIDKALSKIFGTKHDRDMKALTPLVEEVGRLEPELVSLPLDGLKARIGEIRERIESVSPQGKKERGTPINPE